MKLPIDTSRMTLLCATEPEPVVDFETKRPRVDETGVQIMQVGLVALGDGAAELLQVKVASDLRSLSQGSPVKVTGLVATPWSMGDRSGISFRAQRVEPLSAAPAATPKAS